MLGGKRICVFAANDAGEYAFKHMLENSWVDLVITIDEKKAEKLGISNYLDVRRFVESERIYYAKKYNLRSEIDLDFFKRSRFDIGFVIGWNRLIPKEIIETFSIGIFGFHGTPFGLPKGRGRSPTIWTLVLGYDRFFLHMFKLTEGIDDGPIFDTQKIEVLEADDIRTLHMKTSYWSWKMIERTLPKILNGYEGTPQTGTPIYFRKRTEKDGQIRWYLPTKMIYNLVRAITKPYPGAYTFYKNQKIRIWKAIPFDKNICCSARPGTVCINYDHNSFVVKSKDGTLLVTEYEPEIDIAEGDMFD